MLAQELVELHDELERLLQVRGPVQFIRDIILQSQGAQVLTHDLQKLPDGGRSTVFRFCDTNGDEALLTVVSTSGPTGAPIYSLTCSLHAGEV